ncbi:hypothetical protein U879_03945 [Defluviimonas sp. 20V17]|uniref:Uncharacterized protein n=1 Tax=Allgaiera indica TaxID=765699 RepID=A0A1H3E300_9RHOB|nr:hypothetical protein [Allgaiera indica]KDB04983.1 hypothetical protein U879_03945 [Defluviimonas sp. 20V17]SDX72289.1 hypothetical protein SAMN05444006_12634 [Allgaiera indica]
MNAVENVQAISELAEKQFDRQCGETSYPMGAKGAIWMRFSS